MNPAEKSEFRHLTGDLQKSEAESGAEQKEQLELPSIGGRYKNIVLKKKVSGVWASSVRLSKGKKGFVVQNQPSWKPVEGVRYEIELTESLTKSDQRDFYGRWFAKAVDAARDQKAHLLAQQEILMKKILAENSGEELK